MRVLLEGWKLARDHNWGGVESYWQQLLPALQESQPVDTHLSLASAFLHPRHHRTLDAFRLRGARLRHFWAKPDHLLALGRLGFSSEWLGGEHDLVHAGGPAWPFRTKGRLVVTCHDLMFEHHPQFLHPKTARRMRQDARELRQRAALWICISETAREDLVSTYKIPRARTAVALPGVRQAFFDQGQVEESSSENPYFLFLGSHEPKKNVAGLLKAFALARSRGLQSDLQLAGRLPAEFSAPKEKSMDGVRSLGFVSNEKLPALLGGARALVLPSWHEGFGMPVLEAMACGTPVLCSKIPALEEVSGGAAETFEPGDVDQLAEMLLAFDADTSKRENLRRAGRQHATTFTWQRCAKQVHQAYQQAMTLPR